MINKRELKDFFLQTCTDATIVKFDYVSPEKFYVAIKCRIKPDAPIEYYSQYFGSWMKKFGKFTSTSWIVRASFPKMVRMVYRKSFACHLSGFNKNKNMHYHKSRNQECRALVDFVIKKITKGTMRNDVFLREKKLNLNIVVDFKHTHLVHDVDSLHTLKSTDEMDQKIFEYFKDGYSPANAISFHEMLVIDKYGDNNDALGNPTININSRHVHYLYSKKCAKIRDPEIRDLDAFMADRKRALEGAGGTLIYTDNAEMIIIVTPLMKRVYFELGADIVIVDSTALKHCVVTLFYVPSKVGPLPIACAVHASLEEANFSQTFLTVKITLENNYCNQNFEPKLLMTNDLKDQVNAASAVFPSSKRVSMPFDVCKTFWIWLNDADNDISRKKRHPVMVTFRQMIFANTLESAQKHYDELTAMETVETSQKLRENVEDVWQRVDEWRNDEIYRYCEQPILEVTVTFTKQLLLQRCRNFPANLMTDIVATVVEKHFCRMIQAFATGRQSIAFLTKFLAKTKDVMGFGSGVQKIDANEFRIPSTGKTRRVHVFRIDSFCCDCVSGGRGQFCEHLCGIVYNFETIFSRLPMLATKESQYYMKLSGNVEFEEPPAIPDGQKIKVEVTMIEDNDDNLKRGEEPEEFADDDEMDPDYQPEDQPSRSTSPKVEDDDDDYYLLDVKSKKGRDDPLQEMFGAEDTEECSQKLSPDEFKAAYEQSLKEANNEFRRLNKLFKGNANKANWTTMTRLTRELAKIRPIERVNLKNMTIELNDGDEDDNGEDNELVAVVAKKRKANEDSDS